MSDTPPKDPPAETGRDDAPGVEEWAEETYGYDDSETFDDHDEVVAVEPRMKKRKPKKKDLKQKIKELEAEVEDAKRKIADEPLYGLTPRLEAAITRALDQGRLEVVPRLLRPLHPADQADLIERMDKDHRAKLVHAA